MHNNNTTVARIILQAATLNEACIIPIGVERCQFGRGSKKSRETLRIQPARNVVSLPNADGCQSKYKAFWLFATGPIYEFVGLKEELKRV